MTFKRIAIAHLALTIVLAVVLGIETITTDDERCGISEISDCPPGSVNVPLIIPLAVVLVFIGIGGPVILGSFVLSLVAKRNQPFSQMLYLATFYGLLLLLFILMFTARSDTAGFGIFLVPWLPLPALVVAKMISWLRESGRL